MSVFLNPMTWFAFAAACILEGTLLIMGRAKGMSSFYWSKENENDPDKALKYLKKDGIGGVCVGVAFLLGAFLMMKGKTMVAGIIIIVSIVAFLAYEVYLSRQMKKEK